MIIFKRPATHYVRSPELETPYQKTAHPTQANGLLVGVACWLDFHGAADKDRWPKLAALRSRLEADPAVIYATALDAGETRPGNSAWTGHVELEKVIERFGTLTRSKAC